MIVHVLLVGEKRESDGLAQRIRRFLPDARFQTADDGPQAIRLARELACLDLAFVNIRLTNGDGLSVARVIRTCWKNCGIVFLTDCQDYETLARRMEVEAVDYLLKPFSQTGIEAVIQKISQSFPADGISSCRQEENLLLTGAAAKKRDRERILRYLRDHFGEPIGLERIAEDFGTSPTYFCKKFRRLFQESFVEYLTAIRLEEAKRMLEHTDLEMQDIAAETGFQTAAYFSKKFRETVGCTPTEYRGRYQKHERLQDACPE